MIYCLIDCLVNWLIDWLLLVCLIVCSIDRTIDRLIDWLIDWLIDLDLSKSNIIRSHSDLLHLYFFLILTQVEENRRFRVHINGDLMFKSEYIRSRSVFGTIELKKGRYVLFPTTKEAGDTGKFMLRLYTSSLASSR